MTEEIQTFKRGDIVKYTAKFLKSVGMHYDVPRDGVVLSITGMGYPRVRWCDDQRPEGQSVHPSNIMLADKPDYSGM